MLQIIFSGSSSMCPSQTPTSLRLVHILMRRFASRRGAELCNTTRGDASTLRSHVHITCARSAHAHVRVRLVSTLVSTFFLKYGVEQNEQMRKTSSATHNHVVSVKKAEEKTQAESCLGS